MCWGSQREHLSKSKNNSFRVGSQPEEGMWFLDVGSNARYPCSGARLETETVKSYSCHVEVTNFRSVRKYKRQETGLE